MAKTVSEELFERYLNSIGVDFDYEPDFGGRKPDYGIKDEKGGYQAVVEIEAFMPLTEVPEESGGFFNPYKPIRKKINRARSHFQHTKHLPCLLVLYNINSLVILDKAFVLSAMLGDLAIQVPIGDHADHMEPKTVFTEGGKMTDSKHQRGWNTTISAIAILEEICIEWYRSGFEVERQSRITSLDMEGIGESIYDIHHQGIQPIEDELIKKYQSLGFNLDRKVPHLRLFQNPYARIPWPDHLRSDADEIWSVIRREGGYTIIKSFDGLATT